MSQSCASNSMASRLLSTGSISKRWKATLFAGKVEKFLQELARRFATRLSTAHIVTSSKAQINYFTDNKESMHYEPTVPPDCPIGSGTIESACKNVIAGRMKQGGMTWSERGRTEWCRSAARSPAGDSYRISWQPWTGRHESTYLLKSLPTPFAFTTQYVRRIINGRK